MYDRSLYIDIVPNRNSPPAILLRETRRVGKRSVKRTVANLSACPLEAIEALRLALKGIPLVPGENPIAYSGKYALLQASCGAYSDTLYFHRVTGPGVT